MKRMINSTFINQKPSAGKWNTSFEILLEAIKNVSNAQWLDCNQMKPCRIGHNVAGMSDLSGLDVVSKPQIRLDVLVKSLKTDGKVKSAKFKACESRVTRRTYSTSQ